MTRIPNRETCLELLKRRGVPEHIIAHSVEVERVARFLGSTLNDRGERLDLSLLQAAALLHDVTKFDGLATGENHARTGSELIRKWGYPRVADLVAYHVVIPRRPEMIRITEEEVLNYADKRVMHDRCVTLDERFTDLRQRYGMNEGSKALILASLERAREIEDKIFDKLSIRPEELPLRMKSRPQIIKQC